MASIPDKSFIEIARLEPADVILTGDYKLLSRFVSWATGAIYSHAAIYVGDGLLFESTSDGIGFTPIPCQVHRTLGSAETVVWDVSAYSAIDVFRLADEYRGPPAQPGEVSSILRATLGGEWGRYYPHIYRVLDAAPVYKALLPILKSPVWVAERFFRVGGRRLAPGDFCSQLVANCFEELKWRAFKHYIPPNRIFPNHLSDSKTSNLVKLDLKIHD